MKYKGKLVAQMQLEDEKSCFYQKKQNILRRKCVVFATQIFLKVSFCGE